VTQLGIEWKPKPTPSSEGRLVLNGQLIEDSQVSQHKNRRHEDMLSVSVSDTTAGTILMRCRFAEIAEQFDKLTLPLTEAPSEYFKDEVELVCRDYDGIGTLRLDFDFYTDVEYWAKRQLSLPEGEGKPARGGVPYLRNTYVKIGVGGPVGSGETVFLDTLCKHLRQRYDMAVITN
jgi:hypothetical protein